MTNAFCTTHLFSLYSHRDVKRCRSKNSGQIQLPVKTMQIVSGLQILLSLVELYKSFQKWVNEVSVKSGKACTATLPVIFDVLSDNVITFIEKLMFLQIKQKIFI